MGVFTEIVHELNRLHTQFSTMPTAIKVNPTWMEKQLQQQFVLRGNENPLTTFTGLPVIEDENVETFEFVFKKEQ